MRDAATMEDAAGKGPGESLPALSRGAAAARVRFFDYHPTPSDVRNEVLCGLARSRKQLPPKLFYDRRGSQLFDAITELPEYYPTRTEIGILRRHGVAMADRLGRGKVLIELGSGSSLKIQILLAALQPRVYIPVDISKDHLLESAHALAVRFPDLAIRAACADYSAPFELPLDGDGAEPIAFFPGSSIGNFEPDDARRLLARLARLLGDGGRLLVGVDLRKDAAILCAAYNDAQGVTAAFNLNLLARINRELGADFDPSNFEHQARFNEAEQRVEMHLVSRRDHQVRVAGRVFAFARGESIHTENSYKYDIDHFQHLAGAAGFATETVWTDADQLFSVHCLRVSAAQ